jgi:hypothetical protein
MALGTLALCARVLADCNAPVLRYYLLAWALLLLPYVLVTRHRVVRVSEVAARIRWRTPCSQFDSINGATELLGCQAAALSMDVVLFVYGVVHWYHHSQARAPRPARARGSLRAGVIAGRARVQTPAAELYDVLGGQLQHLASPLPYTSTVSGGARALRRARRSRMFALARSGKTRPTRQQRATAPNRDPRGRGWSSAGLAR